MESTEYTVLISGIMSMLLAIVTYFMRQLLADFKRVEQELSQVRNTMEIIRTEFKGMNELLNQRINFLEMRVDRLEHETFHD